MIKQKITCDVQANTVKRELVEDNTPVWVDYQCEIDECKQRLAQTDYVIIKIAEKVATRKDYADIIPICPKAPSGDGGEKTFPI
jgi:hypothetical protein